MSTPKPGSAEWQKQIDDAVADHDAQQQASDKRARDVRDRPRPVTARRDGVCGAVSIHPEGGSDCLCLLDEHDTDRVHRCSTRGCGREWFDKPLKTAKGAA